MKKKIFIAGFLVLLLAAAGGYAFITKNRIPTVNNPLPKDAAAALTEPSEVTLFSLDPSVNEMGEYKGKDSFHGWKIHGQAVLVKEKAAIAAQEFKETGELSFANGGQAMCFWPRHGLQVVNDGHTYDFVLCFECAGMHIYKDDTALDTRSAIGSSSTLDKLLTEAGVPLGKRSGP